MRPPAARSILSRSLSRLRNPLARRRWSSMSPFMASVPPFGERPVVEYAKNAVRHRRRARPRRAISGIGQVEQCAQQLRSAYHAKDLGEGWRIAEKVVDSCLFGGCQERHRRRRLCSHGGPRPVPGTRPPPSKEPLIPGPNKMATARSGFWRGP